MYQARSTYKQVGSYYIHSILFDQASLRFVNVCNFLAYKDAVFSFICILSIVKVSYLWWNQRVKLIEVKRWQSIWWWEEGIVYECISSLGFCKHFCADDRYSLIILLLVYVTTNCLAVHQTAQQAHTPFNNMPPLKMSQDTFLWNNVSVHQMRAVRYSI